jgi:hypothetical protein
VALQVTSFSDEDQLNAFLGQHKWRLGEIHLIVTNTNTWSGELVDSAQGLHSTGMQTRLYLLHPAVSR